MCVQYIKFRYAIKRTKNRIFFFFTCLSFLYNTVFYIYPSENLNPSFNIHSNIGAARTEADPPTTSTDICMCTQNRGTRKQRDGHCSIQYQHTVTTWAFHVLFKIMRSSSLLLIEETSLFLPLKRHMSCRVEPVWWKKEGGIKGSKKRKEEKMKEKIKTEKMEGKKKHGAVTYFSPPSGNWRWLNPSHTAHLMSQLNLYIGHSTLRSIQPRIPENNSFSRFWKHESMNNTHYPQSDITQRLCCW